MNPKKKYFFFCFGPKYFSVVGGRSVRIRTAVQIWHKNRGISSTIFKADFKIFVVVSGPYGTVRTIDCGHEKRGTEEVV
jgi:hypothetical protein